MQLKTKLQLSIMMFLQFFIWGGWFVTLGTFLGQTLGASGLQIGQSYSTQSWGAIVAPFIIGLIADRFFNAEKILAVLHIIGAGLMYLLGNSDSFESFYPYLLLYMILYMPTLALVNTIAFKQMKDPAKEFSLVRVFGTGGWILAALVISWFGWDSKDAIADEALRNTFLMVSLASFVLGVFSFFLPNTPPKSNNGTKLSFSEILGLDAFKLLADRNFLIFFISSVLICIPLAFYYQNLSPFLVELKVPNSTAWTSIGQVSEVLFMLLLPIFFKKFGFKKTLLVGMIAWFLRYVLFAFGNEGELFFFLIMGIALHGICYDFFFVSGQIYTDSKAGEKNKSAAQGLITLATYGIGMLIGFWVSGEITDYCVINKVHDWQNIWILPAGFALLIASLFLVLFKSESIEYKGS